MTAPALTAEEVERWIALLEGDHVILETIPFNRLISMCKAALAHLRTRRRHAASGEGGEAMRQALRSSRS